MAEASRLRWKPVIAWSLYDWANSAYATTVMAGFFPIFFASFWRPETVVPASRSTAEYGYASGTASLIVALMAPILGTIADQGSARKKFLALFTFIGAAASASLFLVPEKAWLAALVVYGLSMIGFSGALSFYDSLLVDVAPPDRTDFVSGMGYSFGYLGGGVLFAINVLMVQKPEMFGLAGKTDAVRWSFLSVGAWWLLFAIPLFLAVDEPRTGRGLPFGEAARAGWRQLIATLHEVRRLKAVAMFLGAYWLYIDGVNTVIKMALIFGKAIGIDSGTLIGALLLTQFVGFPAALIYGWLGEKIGTKLGILIGIVAYAIATILSPFMTTSLHFYGLAVLIGLVQGGVQSLSRSYFGRLIPKDKASEFFGFYNMVGKFAAILGPFLMGAAAVITQSTRFSIWALLLLFGIGGALLFCVPAEGPKKKEG